MGDMQAPYNSDVTHPVGNVNATPTNPGAMQSVSPNMTNIGMTMAGTSGKAGAMGPGKKSGTL